MNRKELFFEGVKVGIPILLGYFAVSFTLGITAKNCGLTAFQATLTSLLVNASAGQFVGFTMISAGASVLEMALMVGIANARYLLMSCALSQKLKPGTPLWQRMLLGYVIADESFGVSIAVEGRLDPFYTYGIIAVSMPGWALGTCLGVILGNILPLQVVSALSVGLYGMFIAVFIPPARKSRVIMAVVLLSFAASFIFTEAEIFSGISQGVKTILLTILISVIAAVIFPVKEEIEDAA